ncbi:hypothetical protein AAFC00_000843 [Neodothiora populina]|uniref:Protein kinase domain-containing protein n=1 Tax=Neodothiora populina TaxID=2781224 RepID=A0ABR3PLY2_9PEZI
MRLRSGEPNEHAQIVEFFAGFTHGGTYNVILEFAEPGTLEDYFQTTMPPRDEMNITSFWRNFLLALSATVSMVHENGGYHGWHGDMKPTNILVFNVENMRAYQSHTFKLADFGLSHFATAVSRGSISRVETSDTWGSAEYAAPETIQTDGSWEQIDTHLAQPADIWSLGCIASEAVTWLVNGIDGLEKYRAQRRNETDGISGLHGRPSFHNGRRKLKIVKDHHRELSNESSRSNQLTLEILRGPIRNMLNSSPPQRPSAQTLYLEIKGIIEKATAGISEPGPSRPSMSISAPGPSLPLMSIEDAAEKVFRGRTKLGKLDDGGMLDKLDKRDHVLLLDNAKTMSQHWPAVQSLTKLLLEITKDYDPNGIDIYFTIHGRHGKFKQINSVDKLNRIQPMRDMRSAPSRLGSVLENILVDYGKRLQSRRPGIFGGNPRPMSIYILTDGLWQDDAARAIRVMARTIDERRVNSDQVGLQFIRFGDEPSGIEKLKNLDDDLGTDPDIVDTTPATQEIYGRFC